MSVVDVSRDHEFTEAKWYDPEQLPHVFEDVGWLLSHWRRSELRGVELMDVDVDLVEMSARWLTGPSLAMLSYTSRALLEVVSAIATAGHLEGSGAGRMGVVGSCRGPDGR
eukprot:TRINITY_DN61311_c0_g1_i1.p2 TRINITY_DN61311_c0_g1~~TRINITY_DN61311_c0_g1_i1.p2  ORF type:complete len:111 (-),score=22.88 TRINITY_DN61311_c0_g1_i1:147-479(-)